MTQVQIELWAGWEIGMDHIIRANAGYSKPFEELSDSQIKRQMQVNFLGSINVVITAVEEAMRG